MKAILFILVLLYAPCLQSQTLEEYLVLASENNPGLKARYAEFEAAMKTVVQVSSLPDPNFTFGYFISPIETRVGPQRVTLTLTQMFPWFGTLAAKGEVATLNAESKYQEFLDAKNELYFKVKEAWYPLYEINRILLLQEENKEILASYKVLSTSAFKNGKGNMVDVIRVDIMIQDIDTEIKLLNLKRKPLLSVFNKLLNREDSISVRVPDSLFLIEVHSNYRKDSLLSSNPMLRAFDLKIASAQAWEVVAQKQGLPKIGVGLDYFFVGNRTDMAVPGNGKDVIMPMVSMSLPVFRKKYKAAVEEAQLMQLALSSYKGDLENKLVSNYDMTWYELDRASHLIDLYREQIIKTDQAVTLLLSGYSNSGKDFEEVLRMQQELLKYKIAEATAVKEFYTALAKLDYITAKSE